MDGPSGLPLASLSLHALAAPGAGAVRAIRTRNAAVVSVRDGPRSHPIAVPSDRAPAAHPPSTARDRTPASAQPAAHPLLRLAAAVPAALGRLVSARVAKQAPFQLNGPARLTDVRVFPSAVRRRAATGGGGQPAGAGARQPALLWFRNDLRLHDNPSLERACREATSVLPVYVFDPREYAKTPGGFDRTGPGRAAFILEAVADLRRRLRSAGSELVVRVGRPEEVLAALAAEVGAGGVYCQAEVTAEEAGVEGRVRARLDRAGCELRPLWGGTLFHPDDLPFRLASMPTNYAEFRSRVAQLAVRPLAESEGGIKGLPLGRVEAGDIPTLQQLGLTAPARPAAASPALLPGGAPAALRGGESEALRHLQAFMDELQAALAAASPASPAAAAAPSAASSAFSCRISPWLALGCLSPRRMYHELQARLGGGSGASLIRPAAAAAADGAAAGGAGAGGGGGAGAGHANWLVFELLWRDFFRFVTQKYTAATTARGAGAGARPAVAAA